MEQQIEYQLARVRASAGQLASGRTTRLPDVALPILKAMERLHPEKSFILDPGGCTDLVLPVDPVDFAELLAILLDNAGKWAKVQVVLALACNSEGEVTVTISDDGPGVPEAELHRIFELGVRLDPEMQGSGLGLAIARDLAKTLGFSLTLANGTPGMIATLMAPATTQET